MVKIAIFGKTVNNDLLPVIREFFTRLKDHGARLYIHEKFSDFLTEKLQLDPGMHERFPDHEVLPADISFIFSLGGDGTFLETANIIGNLNIPVVGINTGRLGFLASISLDNLVESVDAIFKGKYSLEERTLMRLKITGNNIPDKTYTALNDITVHKKDLGMISIHVELNNEYLNSYWADGLIIASPTGSTAYSMSVGGPIILPESKVFIISPVSPHNLSMRPIVIPDSDIIKLRVESRSDEFLVSMDSRSLYVSSDCRLVVDKAPFTIKLVRIQGSCYYSTLRNKLMWGIDKRN